MPITDPRILYLPLRGNTYTLVAGAPGHAFRRRLKVAALLFDEIVLDGGHWAVMFGPSGSIEYREPGADTFALRIPREWQPAQHRRSGDVSWHEEADRATGLLRLVDSSETKYWRATFDPIRAELPHSYAWLSFEDLDLDDEGNEWVNTTAHWEAHEGTLAGAPTDPYTRELVAKSTLHGVSVAARLESGIMLDSLHGAAAAALLARDDFVPIYGADALLAIIPDVRDLPWPDVERARELPGLPRLRSLLREFEREARAAGGPLDEAVLREFHQQYAHAAVETESVLRSVSRSVAIGAAVSVVTLPVAGPLGVVIGVAAPAAIEAVQLVRRRARRSNSWMAAADLLRTMAADEHSRRS